MYTSFLSGLKSRLQASHLPVSFIKKTLGSWIHVNVVVTHGLAFNVGFDKSWRADGIKYQHALVETVAIHTIDLLSFYLGEIQEWSYYPSNQSMRGTAYDTASLQLKFKDNITSSLLFSYAAPFRNEITVTGTNGVLSISDNCVELLSHRDSFNDKGFFIRPPMVKNIQINLDNDYKESLKKSVNYFLKHVRHGKPMDQEHLNKSLQSNKWILDLINNRLVK